MFATSVARGFLRRPVVRFGCASLGALALSAAVRAGTAVPSYTLQDLGTLPGGATSAAAGINNSGQVVGSADAGGGATHAVLFTGGGLQDLGASLGGNSYATGINSSGQVVGYSNPGQAFIYSGGTVQPITGTLQAWGINDSGQVVGSTALAGASTGPQAFVYTNGNLQVLTPPPSSNDAAGVAINSGGQVLINVYPGFTSQAYLYSNGTLQQIQGLGGAVTAGGAINDQGQVVGQSGIGLDAQTRGGPDHAFLYSNGTTQDLGTLPGNISSSSASGINDSGEIVGQSTTASSVVATDSDGFLYLNGTMYDLNTLTTADAGYLITAGVAINASGQIAADAIGPSGQEHAVLLTPVLSPATTSVPLPAAAWASLTMLPLLLLGKRVRRVLA